MGLSAVCDCGISRSYSLFLKKNEDFEDFKRAQGQSINKYVAPSDAKYRKIE